MATVQYTVSASDRTDDSSFTVPGDEDGGVGDPSYEGGFDDAGVNQYYYVHVNNGFDVNIDTTLQGSHEEDENMANAAQDGGVVTIPAGEIDFFSVSSWHSYVEIDVDPASNPGTGALTVTFQSRA